MRASRAFRLSIVAFAWAVFTAAWSLAAPADKPVWPLTLREGLPATLPGYAAAPKDELPEDNENEMGKYVEIGRFFQRIESPTSTKQFRVVIQDYEGGKDLAGALRQAIGEAKKTSGVEAQRARALGAPRVRRDGPFAGQAGDSRHDRRHARAPGARPGRQRGGRRGDRIDQARRSGEGRGSEEGSGRKEIRN